MTVAQGTIAGRLREQAEWCRRLGSPLYGLLLDEAAADVERDGPSWAVLAGHENDRYGSMLALRFMGAVHRLVLEGRVPALACHYPSVGGTAGDAAWSAFRDALEEHADAVRALIEHPVQTNEVGRSAALLGGFLMVARATGLPLRVLEIGASAGLNLRWDQYRYECGDAVWGDASSLVRFIDAFVESHPPLAVAATVVERAGCDATPIDPGSDEGRLTLMSYVWPDQTARFALLEAALTVARRVPAPVETADAAMWVAARLATPRPGVATVIFHSIVMQYLGKEKNRLVWEAIQDAGARAEEKAPVAWLMMEPGGTQADVRLTLWPGGREERIATAGYHGQEVHWLASPPAAAGS